MSVDRHALAIGATFMALLAVIRVAVLLTGHVPMGHDTFQYLQLQYLVFSEAANTNEIPLWLPLMTHGTVSNIWVTISQGLLSSVITFFAPLLKSVNYLPLFQAGLLVDEGVLLLGTLLLARRCYRRSSAVIFTCAAVAASSISIVQVWFNFHFLYLIPLILYCADRAQSRASARYLFLALLFGAATLLGNLPYFLPITGFVVCVFVGLAAALHPQETVLALARFRRCVALRFAVAILVPVLLVAAIGAFELYGWIGQVSFENSGRSGSGEVTSLTEFLSYAGYVTVWKWMSLVARYDNNLDNSMYAGLLIVPFALTAALRVRSRLSMVFGGTALVIALFGAATAITVGYYYLFPLGKLFRHIGLTAPLAVMFLVFYAGFGVQWLEEALATRSPVRGRLSNLDPGVWIPVAIVTAIAAAVAAQRAELAQVFVDYAPWAGIPTRQQLVLNPSDVAYATAVVFVLCVAMGSLLFAIVVLPVRWLNPMLGVLLFTHTADVFSWKAELEFRQTPSVPSAVQQLFDPLPTPYVERRSQAYSAAPRFATVAAYLFDRPEDLIPTLPAPTVGSYGAQYWSNESFLHMDAIASIFRTDHWLQSVEAFYLAWGPGPRGSARHLGFPIPSQTGYYRLVGSSADKLQVFNRLHVVQDEDAIAAQFRSSSFSGNALLATSEAVRAAQVPIDLLSASPAPDGVDEHVREANIRVTQFSDNMLRVHVEVPAGVPALLYYADGWHPFWHATVNGVSAAVIRANLGYKAVTLPEGESDVVFTFGTPWSVLLARLVQSAGAAALIGAVSLVADLRSTPSKRLG